MHNNFLYETQEWRARTLFIQFVTAICKAEGVTITWFSSGWIARLEKANAVAYLYGYTFPLNNAVASAIMRDKTATYEVLAQQDTPAVPHFLLRSNGIPTGADPAELALAFAPLPLVIKPSIGGSGGREVFKCQTKTDLKVALKKVMQGNKTIAVSPLVEVSREFRVVVLDGCVKLMFEKQRQGDEWQHNLRLGATPQEVADKALAAQLSACALDVINVLQARLAAVDIVETPHGLTVMEVNGGIMMGHFSEHSPANHAAATALYTEIITKSLL